MCRGPPAGGAEVHAAGPVHEGPRPGGTVAVPAATGVATTAIASASAEWGSAVAGAARPPRPMLLAPINAVVNERNARELQDITQRNKMAGRMICQWMACDWAVVDEDLHGVQASSERRPPDPVELALPDRRPE